MRYDYSEVVRLRNAGQSWGNIAKQFDTTKERARAAYRRAVGAKESAYSHPVRFSGASPRAAILDIETLPMIIYAWGLWDEHNGIEQVITDSCMLSWAGRYLNSAEMHSDILRPDETKSRDTRRITASLWDFLHEADIVIGHNFAGFDVKYINTEFLKHGLPPLKFIIVDTLQVARINFHFSSNKMKYINGQLGIRNKIENDGFPLWRACSEGDKDALKTMLEYNEGDIGATEELFYRLRPYVRNINIALYTETDVSVCPTCGSADLSSEGWYYTPAGKWESMRCNKCQCLSRTKYNELTTAKKKSLLVNS